MDEDGALYAMKCMQLWTFWEVVLVGRQGLEP